MCIMLIRHVPPHFLEHEMKVSQLVRGERYESKDGGEIRQITSVTRDGTLHYVVIPIASDAKEARRIQTMRKPVHVSSQRDFAAWAARKVGTSMHQSVVGAKFLNAIKGPTG